MNSAAPMMSCPALSLLTWIEDECQIDPEDVDALRLRPALDVFINRLESARARGARDPLASVSPRRAGGNSRRCTRRMLRQLGYTDVQLRIIHRLVAGSTGGWPGLLRLFVDGKSPDSVQRQYIRRQVRSFIDANR
ncbi:hypothetical protein N864_16470 [Intrasporangium chromatireducens Q5-1]|uniref:Uncharacterized protein n=1 Tax=Intrasporangium chromatireducens Q5-1 TaxID=584657 RepID=W9GPR3_9MICO|nr:hypothetical protein [Intrasporangium chromatireducens]EWT06823.1 hypothetical protein N864_16470 [Intrasporangium chromatireducens Q5-1]